MSHSSLSAQLASLHTKNTTSSRQQADATGRGIHHSANAGHSILNNNNTKHKPSVLHADSRAAATADVPFTTLRENAVVSLHYLSEHCSPLFEMSGENLPWQTLFGSKSIKHERGLNTPETNAKFDGMIKEALYLLSSAWGDAASTIAVSSITNVQVGASIPASVLHALEYLVQKYYVHVFNAEHLLSAFLPHHETFLFDRLLQLIDLAQMPHWAFLRPYSAAIGVNGVPRTIIAKWAASTKDNGGGTVLVKHVCELAKRGAKIHALERNMIIQGEDHEVRRGTSIFISFAAAILAETLHLQYSTIGSIDEATLRCLVPFVLGAVEPNNSKKKKWSLGASCSEWRTFGHILISLLVDKCDLSSELCEAFSTGIVRGAIESIHLIQSENHDDDDDIDMESSSVMHAVLDVSADAILAMFSLVVSNRAREKAADDGIQRYLPTTKSAECKVLGCSLSFSSFKALMKLPFLPATLGYLLEEKDIDIKFLVGCIIAMSISTGNSTKCQGRDHENNMSILSGMFEEPSLRQIWTGAEESLAASTAAFIVEQAAVSRGDTSTFDQIGDFLATLKTLNSVGCDAGIAFAVTKASSIADATEKELNGSNIKLLLKIAGLLSDKDDVLQGMRKNGSKKSDIDENFDSMLPPSVALEHPSKNLRLDAIAKLTESVKNEGEADGIATALVRRYMSDDDCKVASASAEGIVTMYRNEILSDIFFLQNSVAKDISFGITERLKSEDPDVILSTLQLAGIISKVMKENVDMDHENVDSEIETMYDCFESIVHGIVMILERLDDSSSLLTAASEALHHSLNQGNLAKSKCILMKKSMRSTAFQKIIQRCIISLSSGHGEHLHRKEQLVWFFLRKVEEVAENECGDELSQLMMDACLLVLRKYKKKMKKTETFASEAVVISSNLDKCVSYLLASGDVSEVTRLVSNLCTIESNIAYEEVCLNILKAASKSGTVLYPHILMEVVSHPNLSSDGVKRILSAIELIIPTVNANEKATVLRFLLVCITALCCHSDLSVRESALDFLGTIESSMNRKDACAKAYSCISSLMCTAQAPMRSQIMMDGSNALPKVLSTSVKSQKDGELLKETLLTACAEIATKNLLIDNDEVAGEGMCHSVVVLMEAMEAAGEDSFALSFRWRLAGKPIFDHFLDFPSSKYPSPALQSLVDCVVVMLKGVTVESAGDGIVISTGPNVSGRRRRSYSVGNANGVAHIDPYPDEMVESITSFLTLAVEKQEDSFVQRLCGSMNQLVLGRSSWSNGIFPTLKESVQDCIIKTLLILRSDASIESAGLALLGLPLTAQHFEKAISSNSSRASQCDAKGFLALTALMDCIRAQASRLGFDQSTLSLSTLLYKKLSSLSSGNAGGDGSDYVRTCVIHALLALTTNNDLKPRKDEVIKLANDISSHSSLLVALLGEGDKDVIPLVSSRSKSLCLQLLTRLCELSPTAVIESLVPALISSISFDGGNANASKDAMMAIVPAYCKHAASAGYSLLNLLSAFLQKCNEVDHMQWETKMQLYTHLNDALLHCSGKEDEGSVAATVVTIFIANQAFGNRAKSMDYNENSLLFLDELLSQVDADVQIAGTLKILQYIGSLIPQLQANNDELMEEDSPFFTLGAADICSLILKGPQMDAASSLPARSREKIPVFWSALTLLGSVKQIYATGLVKKVIRHGNDEQASVCLNIWQELMVLQSNTARIRFEEAHSSTKINAAIDRYWESMGDEIGDILSHLQNLLPVPHFLASVGSLIQDTDVEVDIQRKAILLLAERSMEIDNTSHEAVLFLEMLPDLVSLAGVKLNKEDDDECYRRSIILSQSSFKAIDQLSKSLGLSVSDDKLLRKRSKSFVPALQVVADSLHIISSEFVYPIESATEEEISTFNLEVQVLSSAALCAASLLTLLNAKCLSSLPKIVKPLISLLTSVNAFQKNNKDQDVDDTIRQSMRLIQLSTLRALVAAAEHVPHFFIPYVGNFLIPHGLPSSMLRIGDSDEEVAVSNMADRLDRAIALGSPVRQLIPILSKSTSKCLKKSANGDQIWKESLVIFKLMKLSIEKATRADLGPLAGKIINSLIQAYAFDSDMSTRCELIDIANGTLLAMVMKLSEAQLRPLYAKLREWRGEIERTDSDDLAVRRRSAFWSLSSAMSRELRSIFLPCMSTVVGDIAKELEFAVSCLCSTSKLSRGHKRQKMEEIVSPCSQSISALQPLLLCLESALKADAHEGGNWIRGDDGQRYNQVLQPLAKLLSASVPNDCDILPMLEDERKMATGYERLVQGVTTEDHGNVINCLTALAAAAGNEQLWKPLNHALLEACGNERRSEVRQSGVKALLSIIHALGEEYMVLLPECLPVLSELLEDESEEIVALAKECVQQGEELLGESLEDSLR